MNRELLSGICVIVAIALGFFLGQGPARPRESGIKTRRVLYYVDPMHPAYKSDKPGIAPDCGMQLEPVYADGVPAAPAAEGVGSARPAGAGSIDPEKQRLLGVSVSTVAKAPMTHDVRLFGRVVADETRVYTVNAALEGS